jgi:hypothetical protein
MEQPNGSTDRPITFKDLTEAEDRIVNGVVDAIKERLETLETKLLSEFLRLQ